VLGEWLRGVINLINRPNKTIRFLEMLNENNTRHINHLENELRFFKEQNTLLLKRLGITERLKTEIDTSKMEPIGGYKSLRSQIREAEELSRIEYQKMVEEGSDESV